LIEPKILKESAEANDEREREQHTKPVLLHGGRVYYSTAF
jgi:hypothetical protein